MDTSFPTSLRLLGLSPGFTQKQFNEIMLLERSDYIRNLAHHEWLSEQTPELDDKFNYRWHLSYVSMKNQYTVDLNSYNNLKNNREP